MHTDHQALKWLHNTKDTNDCLYQWFIKLAHDRYDYTVVHHLGKDHRNADGMSRLMCKVDFVSVVLGLDDTDCNSNSDSSDNDQEDPAMSPLIPNTLLLE